MYIKTYHQHKSTSTSTHINILSRSFLERERMTVMFKYFCKLQNFTK